MSTGANDRANRSRAVSEATGIAVLAVFAIGVTVVAVFAAVTLAGDSDPAFSFEPTDNGLTISYDDGPDLVASELAVEGPAGAVDWATLAGLAPDATVTPGSSQQIGLETAYGEAVADDDRIEIVYTGDGDREVLAVRESATP
jgi:hypothetical protein